MQLTQGTKADHIKNNGLCPENKWQLYSKTCLKYQSVQGVRFSSLKNDKHLKFSKHSTCKMVNIYFSMQLGR